MSISLVDKLTEELGHLVNDETTSDVKFLIGKDEEVRHGHSLVLASRSPYFRLALNQSWKEVAEGVFRKPNIEPPVFDLLLRYMYTGKIEMKMDAFVPVVDAARELQLTQLVSACEDYGCQAVGMETVCDLLLLADRHDLKKLWTRATNFCCNWAEKLLVTDYWLRLDIDILLRVLSLDSIIANELLV
ncbi:hypothetical protein DFQ26_005773 [Actinomortierella ambigua]|nr:hypothetical protein DFQ26_005773 [Actinomortierella ambigua]